MIFWNLRGKNYEPFLTFRCVNQYNVSSAQCSAVRKVFVWKGEFICSNMSTVKLASSSGSAHPENICQMFFEVRYICKTLPTSMSVPPSVCPVRIAHMQTDLNQLHSFTNHQIRVCPLGGRPQTIFCRWLCRILAQIWVALISVWVAPCLDTNM